MGKNFLTALVVYIGLSLAAPFATQVYAQGGSGDIIVQTIPGPTVASQLTHRTASSWSWYITRASGLVAAVALVILMLSGIGQVTGYTFSFLEPLTAWASHRALGLTFGVAVLVHMFTLLFDHFVPFSLLNILVPWLSDYKPVTIAGIHLGSLFVALGVLSFYASIMVVLSSIFWIDKKPYIWKITHLLSYLIIIAVFIHALYLGTDLLHGWARWLWVASGSAVAAATLHRMWRAKTI